MISRIFDEYSTNCDFNSTSLESSKNAIHYLDWVAYTVIAPSVIAGGLIGNLLNLIVLTSPELRGVTYVYLTGLAVADLGVMLSFIPTVVRLNKVQSNTRWAAFYHAHMELVATNSFMASSIFIVCFLTVDRYMSVCLLAKFKSVHTKKNAILSIVVSYLLGAVISSPLAALKTICVHPGDENTFHFRENVDVTQTLPWAIYIWFSETLVRFGPAFMLAFLNTFIIRKFRKLEANRKRFRSVSDQFRSRHHLDPTDQHHNRNRNYQDEKRLIMLLTSIIVIFFIAMTPAAFLSLLYSERRDDDFAFQVFRAVANNLELGNFALNFYVYFLCSKEFRRVFHLVMADLCHTECNARTLDNLEIDQDDFSRYGTTVRPSETKNSNNVRSVVCVENMDCAADK